MKISRLLPLLCGVLLLASAFAYGTKTVKIMTNAMCGDCKQRIETGLSALDGVLDARLDMTTKKVKIQYDDAKQSEASLRLAITKLGYGADDVAPNPEARESLPGCCKAPMDGEKASKGASCH